MGTPLFDNQPPPALPKDVLGAGTAVFAEFALDREAELLSSLTLVVDKSPFRNMITPRGFRMSVAMSNCGALGWVTDRTGYRYSEIDPETNHPWPEMPRAFRKLAESAANEAGFPNFVPDSCLINRYEPGTKLSLHQDKDERDFTQPIVSVSLGLPATFLFGGLERADKVVRIPLVHGDVVVWGGPARLRYHGVSPLQEGEHPLLGRVRYNLTFRKAGLA
jgi:alkylated DNA repair protein (DNA oxidative demethylase)